ncbi:MAG: response regulator [Chloroflexi bacterium]|nr:MAG: response regulator [Chloroflexota bacterium]
MKNQIKPFALIIEDSISAAKMFSLALEEAGFNTDIILDGITGINRLAEITPDVIVLDLHLPFATGEEILQQIQNKQRFQSTRIIIATADANFANFVQDRADFVLLKPISYEQLNQLATRLQNVIIPSTTHKNNPTHAPNSDFS